MTFMGKSSIHAGVVAFLLWSGNPTLAGSNGGGGGVETQHLQQLSSRDLGCRGESDVLVHGHAHMRGGACPDKGVEAELSTAEASARASLSTDDEAADEVDSEDQDATVPQEDDAAVAAPDVATDGEVEVEVDIGAEVDVDVEVDVPDDSSRLKATELRLAGKEAHDKGDYELAAELFQKAADAIQSPSEEYATCRLHQALCYLKSENYDECLDACSDILDRDATHTSAVRARAYHRRAKAKLALDDQTGALQDARSAAFLGDRKAVALYGRLMRESSSSLSLPTNAASITDGFASSASTSSPSAALFESIMSKSAPRDQPGINPASMLFGGENSLLNSLGNSGGMSSGLAKSVISSLSKRLDDENTQTSISAFLQNTNKAQLQQFASMAGMEVPETWLDRIERVCHGVTPKTIRRTLKTTRGAVYVFRIVRRISRLLQKYRSLIVALVLLQWTKSAILRPIPVDRVLAKKQAKAALKDAMKENRAGKNAPR